MTNHNESTPAAEKKGPTDSQPRAQQIRTDQRFQQRGLQPWADQRPPPWGKRGPQPRSRCSPHRGNDPGGDSGERRRWLGKRDHSINCAPKGVNKMKEKMPIWNPLNLTILIPESDVSRHCEQSNHISDVPSTRCMDGLCNNVSVTPGFSAGSSNRTSHISLITSLLQGWGIKCLLSRWQSWCVRAQSWVCVGVAVLTCGLECLMTHRCAAPPRPESNQSDSGQVRLLNPSHQPHTFHRLLLVSNGPPCTPPGTIALSWLIPIIAPVILCFMAFCIGLMCLRVCLKKTMSTLSVNEALVMHPPSSNPKIPDPSRPYPPDSNVWPYNPDSVDFYRLNVITPMALQN